MRVGIDATAFAGPRTGVGNYIAPLLVAMLDQQPQAQFLLYSNDDLDYPDHPRVMHRVSRPKRRGPYWQNTHLAAMIRQDRPDVLWAANGLAPVVMPRGTATVVTIHDLVYKYARDTLPPHSYAGRAVAQPMTARRADRLVAVSAATALDVRTYYGREADEIIHPIAEPQYNLAARHDVPRVRAALQLPDRFLLTAGTLEPRKNLTALLTAYLDVRARGIDLPPLLLAGRKGWRDNDIEQVLRQAEERGWARRLGYVPAPDMPGLYAAADVFVLPSLYEGFGMPLLEAQLCGTPVLHGPHASMTEACGGVGVQLGADAAGLARDLTAYAEGELPLACRTPHSIHNDAGEAAAKMWQQLAAAARGQRGAPRPGRAGSVRAPELRPCRALRHPAGAATSPGRPRLLILAPRLPYPVIGGDRLRIYQVARTLAKDYDLTLLSLCESQAELDMELPDDGVFRHVERILLPPWRSRLNSLRGSGPGPGSWPVSTTPCWPT
ncbi:MAG: hypothetical protein CSB46_07445 [Micrococcales bacterium]|nr:MAG: hypothetical protein CSB46_07445 [Micrococcales bacterium]